MKSLKPFSYLDPEGVGWWGVLDSEGVAVANRMSEDDAILFCAAPDLLEACVAFYDASNQEFGRDIFAPNASPDSPMQKAWLLARAAISKAEKGE